MPRVVHRLVTQPDAPATAADTRACSADRLLGGYSLDAGAQGHHGHADRRHAPGCACARRWSPRRRTSSQTLRRELAALGLGPLPTTDPPNDKETTTMKPSTASPRPACRRCRRSDARPAARRPGAEQDRCCAFPRPAVPDDWHAKMWTVFKESLDKSAPGEFDVQINLNASLFKQGTEPAAMARGNLELASISAFDIAKLVPEFSIFTAGYIIRDPEHQQKVFNGPIGDGDVQAGRREDGRHAAGHHLPRHAPAQPARGAQRQDAGRPQGREAAHAGLARNGCSSAKRWAPPPRRWPSARSTWA